MQFQRETLVSFSHSGKTPHATPLDSEPDNELRSLVEGLLSSILKTTGARAGAVRLLSSDGAGMQLAGAIGLPPEVCDCERQVDIGCGVCGHAIRDHELKRDSIAICSERTSSRFFGQDCDSVVAMPLERQGLQIGVMTLFFADVHDIPHNVSQTFRAFADLVGVALDNARLARENRRMGLLAERQAMANEIHDALAQTLTFARMSMNLLGSRVSGIPAAKKLVDEIDDALAESQRAVRELITHYRSQPDPLGLAHALQTLVHDFGQRNRIELDYLNDVPDLTLPVEHELQIHHIVREMLANVARHSGADRVVLHVTSDTDSLSFVVEDNGCGLPGNGTASEGHYGLAIMRERASHLGGQLNFESRAGQGTRVCLNIPSPNSTQGAQ
jgi:two-component system nitrate/nitrite sensor histidine kinase NarX